MHRRLGILEPLAVFGLIVWYIWQLRASCPRLWIAILGIMLLSHAVRRESPARLGFGLSGLRDQVRDFAPLFALLALAMLACGLLFRTIRPIDWRGALPALVAYLPWGLLQQYILNGYFLNRFDAVFSKRVAAVAAASLFCAAHAPNWFLMIVALAGGYCATRIYHRYRNLYLLAIAHAVVGFLLFLVVPDSISHHLRVGPGWYVR